MNAAPGIAEIERMARDAFEALPEDVRAACASVLVSVEEVPDRETLDAMEIDDPLDLTGVYEGIPLTEKSVSDPVPGIDTVRLFREPILDEWRERGNVTLPDLVAHILVHELAHHLGWSDDDIAEIDPWWE